MAQEPLNKKKIQANILVVDDDVDILVSARLLLKQHFTGITICDSPKQLDELLRTHDIDIILLDMNYQKGVNTGREGLYWLKHILSIDPGYQVIMMTAFGEVEMAVNCLKAGATDFILKPWNIDKLIETLTNAARLRTGKAKLEKAAGKDQGPETKEKAGKSSSPSFDLVVGEDPAMQSLMNSLRKVAPTDANILILGENGTGKQVIAREIHRQSERAEQMFMHVDLGSLSSQLFESELFGYARGAFTDAREERPGRFEAAAGGTIFLDEIGNLSAPLQAKLLHVLQNRAVVRLGESKERKVDVRLICATNMPLEEMVEKGEFRQDLLYRINTVELKLPPLRSRKKDVVLLARHFLDTYNKKYHKQMQLTREALDALLVYPWPGNIRELQHVMERAVILTEEEQIGEADLNLRTVKIEPAAVPENLGLEEMELLLIRKALEKHKGNISKAATDLGLTRAALYRRMEKFNL